MKPSTCFTPLFWLAYSYSLLQLLINRVDGFQLQSHCSRRGMMRSNVLSINHIYSDGSLCSFSNHRRHVDNFLSPTVAARSSQRYINSNFGSRRGSLYRLFARKKTAAASSDDDSEDKAEPAAAKQKAKSKSKGKSKSKAATAKSTAVSAKAKPESTTSKSKKAPVVPITTIDDEDNSSEDDDDFDIDFDTLLSAFDDNADDSSSISSRKSSKPSLTKEQFASFLDEAERSSVQENRTGGNKFDKSKRAVLSPEDLEAALKELEGAVDLDALLELSDEEQAAADKLSMQFESSDDEFGGFDIDDVDGSAATIATGLDKVALQQRSSSVIGSGSEGIDIGAEGIDPRSVSGEDDADDIRGDKSEKDDMVGGDYDDISDSDSDDSEYIGGSRSDYDDVEDIDELTAVDDDVEKDEDEEEEEDEDDVDIVPYATATTTATAVAPSSSKGRVVQVTESKKASKAATKSKAKAKGVDKDKVKGKAKLMLDDDGDDDDDVDILDAATSDDDEVLDLNPPPLEEFKRLMDALGPDSMFEDDALFEDDDPVADAAAQKAKKSGAVTLPTESDTISALRMKTAASFDFYAEDDADMITDLNSYYAKEDEGDAGTEPWTEAWAPPMYAGGKPTYLTPEFKKYYENLTAEDIAYIHDYDLPPRYLVNVVTVVTSSASNSTALQCAERLVDHLINATGCHPLINFQIIAVSNIRRKKRAAAVVVDSDAVDGDDDELTVTAAAAAAESRGSSSSDDDGPNYVTTPYTELEGVINMHAEGQNSYQLIDGAAMKEAYGDMMPHILMSQKNLNAVANKILFALLEAEVDAVFLSPRLSRVRFRGGSQEMKDAGYNLHAFEPLSVVDVES